MFVIDYYHGNSRVARLSALMFLQFFVWGAWSVTLGLVMQTIGLGSLIGDAFSVGPLASIFGSFALGMLATRFVGPKLLLIVLHIVGAALLWWLPANLTSATGGAFVELLFAYLILYMPTIGLANTVALKTLETRTDRFPIVRAFGTAGWIASGLIVGWGGLSASPAIFQVASAASALLGIYALTLPAVAADASDEPSLLRSLLCVEAFALLRERAFFIFIAAATLISVPLAMYYAYTSAYIGSLGVKNVGGVMALGQVSELFLMFAMPILYRRFAIKPLLLTGMAAWAVRYALFAFGDGGARLWAVYLGVALHGVCYDFFFVAGSIYTARLATPRLLSGQAQGILTLFTYGVGMLVGSQVGAALYIGLQRPSGRPDWSLFWIIPSITAAVIAILFHLFFQEKAEKAEA